MREILFVTPTQSRSWCYKFQLFKIVNEIPVKLLKDAFTLCHLFGCDPEYDNKPRIETLFHMASNFFKISEKDMTVL